MPLSPDDVLALAEFDAEQAEPKRGPHNAFLVENRLKWLRRVVSDLKARVDELEAGPIHDVIAKKDAEIAARDAQLSAHAARVAQLEATKLPDPRTFYRDQVPFPVTGDKVEADPLSGPEIVAHGKKSPHDLS